MQKRKIIICEKCGKTIDRKISKATRHSHTFCSQECANSINCHKHKGHNRSKLEFWLEIKLKEKYPKIKFFEDSNPEWRDGNELACIGEVDPLLAVFHPFKLLKKMVFKNLKRKSK